MSQRYLPMPAFSEVPAPSVGERRILLTGDKDFAELAFPQRAASVGIVLIRLPRCGSGDLRERLGHAL